MIDGFLRRWTFVRGMTTEFLSAASDECLDYRPGTTFVTIREQAGHLAEVQGAYQLAFNGEPVDFGRKTDFGPEALDRNSLLAALSTRDAELEAALDALRSDPAQFRLDWFGNDIGLDEFTSVFIQHEAIHHGQWAVHASLGGFDRPVGWLLNWGL